MIGVSNIPIVAFRGGGGAAANPDFISEWDTTQAGSASDTVVLPLLSGGSYSGTIDWGDGNTSPLSYGNRSHTYASGGTYTITISGSDIRGWQFNNSGDIRKIIDISNWGNLDITTNRAFYGCRNLDVSATDAPIISTTNLSDGFRLCLSLTNCDFSQWDVSLVTNMSALFLDCRSFNALIGNWDMSSVTNMNSMLRSTYLFNQDVGSWNFGSGVSARSTFLDALIFDQDISGWDITGFTDFTSFMNGAQLSTVNYNALLVGWEATLQAAYPSGSGYTPTISISFGSSQYTLGGAAETARTSLITNFGWTISDGGGV